MLARSLSYVPVFVIFTSLIYPAFAQNDANKTVDKKILDLDNTLTPQIVATLSGLSLTGASFLINVKRNTDEEKAMININMAKRSFIKAFFMFLVSITAIFVFDFIEVMYQRMIVLSTILDVIISYAFFGAGMTYLAIAARRLYVTFRK